MSQVQAVIAHQRFALDRREIERRLKDALPEPLDDHFVVIAGKRFPPKQVISAVTGLDRADFNSHQARRLLGRLGFTVGRRSVAAGTSAPTGDGPHKGREAEALRPFMGMWVAQRGLDVLVATDSPAATIAWLEEHGQEADAVFRVPVDAGEAGGAAPA